MPGRHHAHRRAQPEHQQAASSSAIGVGSKAIDAWLQKRDTEITWPATVQDDQDANAAQLL